jgi:16S rRNA (cytosine967-C5)-methyltransferase
MTPAARVQSAIEILDQVIEAARSNGAPADRILADWFRAHRFAGSKDKRAIRELVYGAIRGCGPLPASGRAAMLHFTSGDDALRALFDGSNYGPVAVGSSERPAVGGIAPNWLVKALAASGIAGDEAKALLGRAPLDLRVNTLKADRETIKLPAPGEALVAPQALRFPAGTQADQWAPYTQGLVEVQDHGSQWACRAVGAQPGETVIDLCAGAGGKTLALAAAMDNRGTLVAADTDKRRLGNLPPRAARAGAGMIETLLLDPGKEREALADFEAKTDAVLVDAPCSGTGTWRRNPEARWRLDPAQVDRYAATQARLLELAARLVRPGGRLVYVTCSVLDAEGRDQIGAFLDAHPLWSASPLNFPLGRPHGDGTRLTPFHDGTDGFFIARLELAC